MGWVGGGAVQCFARGQRNKWEAGEAQASEVHGCRYWWPDASATECYRLSWWCERDPTGEFLRHGRITNLHVQLGLANPNTQAVSDCCEKVSSTRLYTPSLFFHFACLIPLSSRDLS